MKILFTFLASISLAFSIDVYAIFNIEAVQDSNLTLDSSGIIDTIKVTEGSVVKKGDILLKLSNADKVAQADSMKQQYIFAKNQYLRYSKTDGAVDQNTLEQYYSNYKQLEAEYYYYRALLDKTILLAPFDGVIAEKSVELGDGVTQSSTTLLRLVSHDKKFVIQFDSRYVDQVKVGDEFYYSVDGAQAKQKVVINKIYPTIDDTTRKVSAEAVAPESMAVGTFGDGTIKTK